MSIDDENKYQDFYQRLSYSKLKRVTDWRLKHKGKCFPALKAGHLRPNDKNFIFSILVGVILFIILGSVLLGLEDELRGAITIWPLLYVFICLMVGSAAIYQSRKFTVIEYVIWSVVNLVYLTIGIIFFLVQYLDVEYTYDLEKRPKK